MNVTEHFVFFLVEDFTHLAFSCAIEPLRIANLVSGEKLYDWTLASEDGASATGSNGVQNIVQRGWEPVRKSDRLFVVAGVNVRKHVTPALLSGIRRERSLGTKIGGICSGAYVLAKAGMLEDVRTAVHWEYHDSFMEEFPTVSLVRSVFVADDRIVTASGGTAAADLMLHLIAETHGMDLSVAVADQMVYNAVRESTAEQRVSLQSRHGMRNAHLASAIQLMSESIEEPLTPAAIAREIGISVRQLERIFGRYLNCSPKK